MRNSYPMSPEAKRESKRRHETTAKGKASAQRYRESEKGKAAKRRWRESAEGQEARRSHDTRYKYGMTPADYDALWQEQGEACAACGTGDPRGGRWHLDHCHETKEIRGIICLKCNVALGMADDNLDMLLDLANYLGGR